MEGLQLPIFEGLGLINFKLSLPAACCLPPSSLPSHLDTSCPPISQRTSHHVLPSRQRTCNTASLTQRPFKMAPPCLWEIVRNPSDVHHGARDVSRARQDKTRQERVFGSH